MSSKESNSKRDMIMDTAERLFAHAGYFGVSVREITEAADIRLASVNYYFQTKQNLYLEVLARRAVLVVSDRLERLEAINFTDLDREQAITEITRAIAEPLLQRVMSGDKGWRAYFTVIADYAAQCLQEGQQAPPMNEIDKLSLRFVEALHRYSDFETDQKAHHAFQFITSTSLVVFAHNGRLNTLSEERYSSDDYAALFEDGIDFIVAGTIKLLSKPNKQ